MALSNEIKTDLFRFFAIAFDAAPGTTYMDQLTQAVDAGMTVPQIVEVFTSKLQFTSVYPESSSSDEFATLLINNVVGASASDAAKAEAMADVSGALAAGWTRGQVIYQIFSNLAAKPADDATWGGTAKMMANQVAVAQYATEVQLVSTANLAELRALIADVTADTDVSTPEAIQSIITDALRPAGQTFSLTNSATADVLILTAGSDSVTGALGTLAATDAIIDGTTTDADVVTIHLNAAAPAARITNVETINYMGDFAATGADLANVTGATTANFTGEILGATATVTNASSNVANIVAGTNISTLIVGAIATGTNGAVTVDTGSAATVNITGGAAADTFVVNGIDANATVGLVGAAGVDAVTVNLTAGGTVTGAAAGFTDGLIDTLTINSSGAANTLNIAAAVLTAAGNATRAYVTGDTAFTLRADLDALQAIRIDDTNSASFTVRADADTTAGAALNAVQADVLDVRAALGAAAYTVNENTLVRMNTGSTTAAATVFNIENVAGNLAVPGTLNLDLDIGASGNPFKFGANVGTVAITADTANLTGAGAGAVSGIDMTTGAVTTVTIAGDKNVTITALTAGANDVLSAKNLTGNLVVTNGTAAAAVTIEGGSGTDTITLSAAGGIVSANAGNDTVVGGAASNTLFGGAGNDNITGRAAADTIDGGDGVDFIVAAAGADTVSGGAGADTINAGTGADTISGGADSDIFVFAAGDSGFPSATVFDTITDWASGDKIDFGVINFSINATVAAAIAGTASISATGLVTFAAADNTLALKIVAAEAALAAGTVPVLAGETAVFVSDSDTYVFVSDSTAGVSVNDVLVKLTGVQATTGFTVDSAGDLVSIV